MRYCSPSDVSSLRRHAKNSHKGDNGRLLILAGSSLYHGSLILSMLAASRFCDLVYAHSTSGNLRLVRKLKESTPNVIAVPKAQLGVFFQKADAILIGPGWESNKTNHAILLRALESKKPLALDATALSMLKPSSLHPNVLITPHAGEFKGLFGVAPKPASVRAMAKKFGCTILCKGPVDFIASPSKFAANRHHHTGMTKGGTGDALAGLAGALMADHNDLFASACAGAYLCGEAGVRLSKLLGNHYNSNDLALAIAALASSSSG